MFFHREQSFALVLGSDDSHGCPLPVFVCVSHVPVERLRSAWGARRQCHPQPLFSFPTLFFVHSVVVHTGVHAAALATAKPEGAAASHEGSHGVQDGPEPQAGYEGWRCTPNTTFAGVEALLCCGRVKILTPQDAKIGPLKTAPTSLWATYLRNLSGMFGFNLPDIH